MRRFPRCSLPSTLRWSIQRWFDVLTTISDVLFMELGHTLLITLSNVCSHALFRDGVRSKIILFLSKTATDYFEITGA